MMPSPSDISPREALISVVMPLYNSRPWIKEAVESIRAQNWPHLEVVAVDDGSSDDSAGEFERLAPDWTLIRTPNRGPSAARNTALRRATGSLVTFLDSDDVWPENKLETQVAAFEAEPELAAVLGQMRAFADLEDEHGAVTRKFAPPTFIFLLGGMLCRRDVFDAVGHFDEVRFPFNSEDTDWFYRAWEQGRLMRILGETTLLYRRRPGSLTDGKNMAEKGMFAILKASLERRRGAAEGKKLLPDCIRYPSVPSPAKPAP